MESFKKMLGYGRSDEKCWRKLVKVFFLLVRTVLGGICVYLFIWNSLKMYYSWWVDLIPRTLLEILLVIALLFYLALIWTSFLKNWIERLLEYFNPKPSVQSDNARMSAWLNRCASVIGWNQEKEQKETTS